MKFPTSFADNAVAVVMAAVMVAVVSQSVSARDLETADGRRFADCTVLKADQLGLYFRHENGIARVLYEDLSEELLAALEPLPEVEDELPLRIDAGRAPAVDLAADDSNAQAVGEFSLVFWQQINYQVPSQSIYCCPSGGVAGLHRYSHFGCRQLAELDFLITSGILPRPPGVVTRRLPRGWRYF